LLMLLFFPFVWVLVDFESPRGCSSFYDSGILGFGLTCDFED
jgi:hypothetical protein